MHYQSTGLIRKARPSKSQDQEGTHLTQILLECQSGSCCFSIQKVSFPPWEKKHHSLLKKLSFSQWVFLFISRSSVLLYWLNTHYLLSLLLVGMFWIFPIQYNMTMSLSWRAFITLIYFPSIPYLFRACVTKECWMLTKAFSASTEVCNFYYTSIT